HPHVVLELRRVLLSRALFGERPWQHELGFEDSPARFHHPVEGGRHPLDHWVANPPLDVLKPESGIALVPMPVEVFGHDSELTDEIAGEVLGLYFAALFPPEADEGIFICAHDDAGIRTADEVPSFRR